MVAMVSFTLFCVASALGIHLPEIAHVTAICGVAALLLFNAGFSVGIGRIPFFVVSEVVPKRYRSLANGMFALCSVCSAMIAHSMPTVMRARAHLCQFINLFFVTTLSFVQLPLYDAVGPLSCLCLFCVPSIALWIFIYRTLPETRGKEVGDIFMKVE